MWCGGTGAASRPTDPSKFFSNGTHEFKQAVLMVSLDGFWADYLDRGFTPHLLDISKQGLRAKFMRPVFPTLTFPNHWSLATGLYAESHGIVPNNFWDPVSEQEFDPYNKRAGSLDSSWWFGDSMWETVGKAGILTANLMGPGPPVTRTGVKPTYCVTFEEPVPLSEKLDHIMAWIDLPLDKRPQFISVYEPSVDIAGRNHGPYFQRVNDTLKMVNLFAKNLQTAMKDRNLTEIVDIVFVSDHGMADTSHPEWVYIHDYLGKEAVDLIEHEDGWPSMRLRFSPEASTKYLNILLEAAKNNSEKFDVYTHETMPERYHLSHDPRITPIYIVPKYGYALTTRGRGESGMTNGNHGSDNRDFWMQEMFVAHGPFSNFVKALHRQSWMPNKNKGWHSTSDDAYVIDWFQNVEVYNLVMRLLGVSKDLWAKTNGTVGFWDRYF